MFDDVSDVIRGAGSTTPYKSQLAPVREIAVSVQHLQVQFGFSGANMNAGPQSASAMVAS